MLFVLDILPWGEVSGGLQAQRGWGGGGGDGWMIDYQIYCGIGIERVGVDFGGEGCSIFYPEVTGGAVLIKKTDRINAISIYILVANFFTPERAFLVTKLPFRHS